MVVSFLLVEGGVIVPQMILDFREFQAMQGCDYVQSGRQGSRRTGEWVNRWVFANGAWSDGSSHYDPPTDPKQLLQLRREYVQAKLEFECKEFREYKDWCTEQSNLHQQLPLVCPAVPLEAPDLLRAGQARITKLREELAVLEKQLEDKAALKRQRDQQEMLAREQSTSQKLAHEIQSINI
jgi:hypothetical protein